MLKNKTVLIESLYSWAEYKIMKEKYKDNFFCIAIYASPVTRFARLQKRKNWRPINDKQTFINRDWTEIEGTDKGGPIAIADYTIMNETSKKKLYDNIDKIIKKIYK
jgi:dephospho-CoA kinase